MKDKKLSGNIAKKLARIENFLADEARRTSKNEFIEKFIKCELCYKELLIAYKEAHNKKYTKDCLKLDMRSVPTVLSDAGIEFDKEYMNKLFGGKPEHKKRGSMSAKILRNDVIHELKVESIEEVFERQVELFELMDIFLQLFREESK